MADALFVRLASHHCALRSFCVGMTLNDISQSALRLDLPQWRKMPCDPKMIMDYSAFPSIFSMSYLSMATVPVSL